MGGLLDLLKLNMDAPHLQFMAQLTAQMSKFFSVISQTCISQLSITQHKEKISDAALVGDKGDKKEKRECSDIANGQSIQLKGDGHQKESKEEAGQPKSMNNKKRKNSILLKPKQPTSCFHMFLTDARQALTQKMGSAAPSEIVKVAAEEWKRLPESEKTKYYQQSDQEQASYREALKLYHHQKEARAETKRAKQKAGKKSSRRKRVSTSSDSSSSSSSSKSIISLDSSASSSSDSV